jgi:hypothetical protein
MNAKLMMNETPQTLRRVALCVGLLLPLASAQALTLPTPPTLPTLGTGTTASSATATLILTCDLPTAAAPGSTPSSSSGSSSCICSGTGSVTCSCTSSGASSSGSAATGAFSFSASAKTPGDLITQLQNADSCAQAKALIETNSGHSSGACSLTSAGSVAPIVYSCDIKGTTTP